MDYTENIPLALIKTTKSGETTLRWPPYTKQSNHYTIRYNQAVTLSCATSNDTPNQFKTFPGVSEIEATCDHEDNFVVNGAVYKVSDLLCDKAVTASVVNDGEICHIEGIDKLKIGFKASKFVELYEACYDSRRHITHSVFAKEATWTMNENVPGHEHDKYEYNCTENETSCCYYNSQLLRAGHVSFSSGAQLSTYIKDTNKFPEWRSCDNRSNVRIPKFILHSNFVNALVLQTK